MRSRKPNCVAGTPCGYTCISGKRNCSAKLSDSATSLALSYANQGYKLPDSVGMLKPEQRLDSSVKPSEADLASANSALAGVLAKAEVRVSISAGDLVKVLESGRFKNTYETGTSGGEGAGALRTAAESRVLGVPSDTKAELRPVYGVLSDSEDPENKAPMYGQLQVVLDRKAVSGRTTFTSEDSFMSLEYGEADGKTETVASRLLEPRVTETLTDFAVKKLVDGKVQSVADLYKGLDTYMEAQVHGGVSVSDISFVRLPEDFNRPDLISKLDSLGIKYDYSSWTK